MGFAALGKTPDLASGSPAMPGELADRQRFRTYFDLLPDYVYLKGRDNRLLEVNAAFEREFGSARDACTLWGDCFPLDSECSAEDQRVMAAGWPQGDGLRRLSTSRGYRWLYLSRFPCMDPSGQVTGIIVHSREADQVAQAREEYRMLLDNAQDAMFLHDLDGGRFLEVNRAACACLGYTRGELLAMGPQDIDSPDCATLVPERLEALRREGEALFEVSHRAKDGRVIPVEIAARVITYHGQPVILSVARDISRHKTLEEELRLARDEARAEADLLGQVLDRAREGITVTDAGANILRVNQAFTAITGYTAGEVMGKNPRVLKSDRHGAEFYAAMWQTLQQEGQWSGEIWNRRKDGEAYPEWLSIGAVRDREGKASHYVAVFHDLTESKQKDEHLRRQAYFDGLTGLPNRDLFLDRLAVAIARNERDGGRIAVLHLDLDSFKTVNESLGHLVGDDMLRETGRRIATCLREADTVCRLAGDDFAVLASEVRDAGEAMLVAGRIQAAIAPSITVGGMEVFLSTGLGVALYPEDGEDPGTLLRNAELAMYRAKECGRNSCKLFAPHMDENVSRKLALESRLRKGLDRDEITVFCQPKVELSTGRIVGFEALARWQQEDGELVNPAEFIPLAEETGLILPLGQQVLDKACRFAAELAREVPGLGVAVNLSPRQFRQPDLAGLVEGALSRAGLAPQLLEVEITESSVMDGVDEAVKKLHLLADLGVGISVDDFGTGYSSLAYLKHFPISELKVDRSFVSGLTRNREDRNIVAAVVALARSFGLRVVAEGVECLGQLEAVRSLDCDVVQGFIFGRPMPYAEFRRLLDTWAGIVS